MEASMGRPPIGKEAMTDAERQRRRRQKLRPPFNAYRQALDLNALGRAIQKRKVMREMDRVAEASGLDQATVNVLLIDLVLQEPQVLQCERRIAGNPDRWRETLVRRVRDHLEKLCPSSTEVS
jgi:hypothetical protein